jgi:hypothetical protein
MRTGVYLSSMARKKDGITFPVRLVISWYGWVEVANSTHPYKKIIGIIRTTITCKHIFFESLGDPRLLFPTITMHGSENGN